MQLLGQIIIIAVFACLKVGFILLSPIVLVWCLVTKKPPPDLYYAEGVVPGSEQDTLANHFFRNPVGGLAYWFELPPPDEVKQRGDVVEPIGKGSPIWQCRWRSYDCFASLRFVLRWCPWFFYEFYVGWKLDRPEDREQNRGMDFALSFLWPFYRNHV